MGNGRYSIAADTRKRPGRTSRRAKEEPATDAQLDRIRDIRDRFEKPRPAAEPARRLEDDIREELRDSRAKTITTATSTRRSRPPAH